MLDQNLTIIEALGLAVTQEISAFKRYKLMAGKVSNPLVREKFLSLAREEKSHHEMLFKMLKSFTGETKPPIPKHAPRFNRQVEADQPLHLLLQTAIQKEQEAQSFYRNAAGMALDPTARKIFEYLAEFERGHERALQLEFDAVAKYPQWFEIEGADIQLLGP
jgi:rubrerythrin